MNNAVLNFLTKSRIKIFFSSVLLGGSLLGAWYTILFTTAGNFSQQPLVVSVLIWMSAIILFSTGRVVSIKRYLSLRSIIFGFSLFTVVCVIVAYLLLDQSFQGLLRVLVGLTVNVLVMILINAKWTASTIYRSASSMRMSLAGNNIFALGTALIGSIIVSISIMSTPLTCEYIYSRYDRITESPLLPIERSQQSLETIGEQSVFSLLNQYKTQNNEETTQDQDQQEEFENKPVSENESRWGGIESAFITAKQSIIDQTLEQRSVVTQNVCELVLGQIEDIRKNVTWNISIVILLLVVLSPLITLRFHLVSYVSRGIFKILIVFGVFRRKKKVITVSELE